MNSNGDGCVAIKSSLEGLGSLAQLRQLLDFEQQLLRLGTCTLAVGTVLDILESPRVRGFDAAAGWLPPGVFSL